MGNSIEESDMGNSISIGEGVVYDGVHGQVENDRRLVEWACSEGFVVTVGDRAALDRIEVGEGSESDHYDLGDMAGDALDHLNDLLYANALQLTWHEGDLLCESTTENEED